jgi:hypothetical protein
MDDASAWIGVIKYVHRVPIYPTISLFIIRGKLALPEMTKIPLFLGLDILDDPTSPANNLFILLHTFIAKMIVLAH